MSSHKADGGYRSRKLWVTIFAMLLLAGVAVASGDIPAIVSLYPTLCGSITSLAAIYLGGNTLAQHLLNKGEKTKEEQPPAS